MSYSDIFLIQSPKSPSENTWYYAPEQLKNRQCEFIERPSPIDTVYNSPTAEVDYMDLIENRIVIEFSTFSELKLALIDSEDTNTSNIVKQTEEEEMRIQNTSTTIPSSVRTDVESSHLLDVLMDQAIQHWCCIGFKIAPIKLEMIENWRQAPWPIVYCVASISLVSFLSRQHLSDFNRHVAMAFYQQARAKMDDILEDSMNPQIIQSYFCLSYTSNLLRLYEHQRTWGGLASISLQHLVKTNSAQIDPVTLSLWIRWYYIDAWLCLTVGRDCLLPDRLPWLDLKTIEQLSISQVVQGDDNQQFGFACIGYYMRKYIRAIQAGKLSNTHPYEPSGYYYQITDSLTRWYSQLPTYSSNSPASRLHLHICYHSMRLVVLYHFLQQPQQSPPESILIDCLTTNLELLQTLDHLKQKGCDQSTYHHMFLAIHNTSKRIFQYKQLHALRSFAEEQLKINLALLKGTQAYTHDAFKMKLYAEMIQNQFDKMNISMEKKQNAMPQILVFKKDASISTKKALKNKRIKNQ
ncbi:hypothetical protein CU097_007127 [Rhizopus azygosporus]|uniref:Transcription factor domain-containing protein n=1 Tax=Rhizopus azygosporus TaxID=86630 RepID=A0A367JXI4_RHIAZ|nr:hypothetical protein CU097_007127 [Rhizopus azygosporus]